MRTIGIRLLKSTLSSVLRDVARGDVYLVTDRGRVVAELRAPASSERFVTREDRVFAELAASRKMRLAERPPPVYRTSPMKSPDGLAAQLIDEDRGE